MFYIFAIDIVAEKAKYVKRPPERLLKNGDSEVITWDEHLANLKPKQLKEFSTPETANEYGNILRNSDDFREIEVKCRILTPGVRGKVARRWILARDLGGVDVKEQARLKCQMDGSAFAPGMKA